MEKRIKEDIHIVFGKFCKNCRKQTCNDNINKMIKFLRDEGIELVGKNGGLSREWLKTELIKEVV